MSMEYIGLAKGNGKAVFLISTRKVEELAGQLQLPCPDSYSCSCRTRPTETNSSRKR